MRKNKQRGIIFLNGYIPEEKIYKYFIKGKCYIIFADGAANLMRKSKILPDVILGDLDSATMETLKYYLKRNVLVMKFTEQETTDFEKSLLHLEEKGIREIYVFGFMSLRPDHSLNNFSIMKRYYKKMDIYFVDSEYITNFIKNKIRFEYKVNEVISLLPFPYAKGIKTKGLQYPLNNEDLILGIREGTLNYSNTKKVEISFIDGDLLLFRKHFL
ncbi:MAG: thiamine diphosphokinase [Ignavibacteria bacterium]|nr:thiamine diphosphokinase [Ignavibacteria bacterium]